MALSGTHPAGTTVPGDEADTAWLEAFHRGERAVLEACYRRHFAVVERAARAVLGAADSETVIHEVFSQLIGRPEMRRSFHGGSLAAWLTVVARNQALQYRRKSGARSSQSRPASGPGSRTRPMRACSSSNSGSITCRPSGTGCSTCAWSSS